MCSSASELIPFYTHTDLYLRPIHKVSIHVQLPQLRQMGQSVSNWEIRERLKKMIGPIELSDFKVQESTLEEVQFVAIVGSEANMDKVFAPFPVVSLLDGITFRAVGFTEPLAVKASEARAEFPTRVDWDQFFSSTDAKHMDEKEPGERPDTVYIQGLPFDWFQSDSTEEGTEMLFKRIFAAHGDVACVDIPQCDPLRKQMEPEINGIQLSSWLFGQDLFFEVYIQFRDYTGFVSAMSALGGKVLVQKGANGVLREAKIKVDFDRSAHLSIRKITQRKLRRMVIEYERDKTESKRMEESKRLEEMMNEEREKREREERERVMRRMLRAERRQRLQEQRNFEQLLRRKLKHRFTNRLECTRKERERQAKALLRHVAQIYREQKATEEAERRAPTIQELASQYVQERGLPDEEALRERILRKQELNLRTRITSNDHIGTSKPSEPST